MLCFSVNQILEAGHSLVRRPVVHSGGGCVYTDTSVLISLPRSVFVNGRPRPTIMDDMRRRIQRGDIESERREAIQAMCDIAADRAATLQA